LMSSGKVAMVDDGTKSSGLVLDAPSVFNRSTTGLMRHIFAIFVFAGLMKHGLVMLVMI
jgi:hypothetical protein